VLSVKIANRPDIVPINESTQPRKNVYHFAAGRQFTVSLALPGSILDNAQSPELRTYLAGQVRKVIR